MTVGGGGILLDSNHLLDIDSSEFGLVYRRSASKETSGQPNGRAKLGLAGLGLGGALAPLNIVPE